MKNVATAPAAKANKVKKFKPWQKSGKTAERFGIVGVNEGDKIKFLLDGKMVTGTYKYGKSSERHPDGKIYIEKGGKIYKRVLEHVEAIAAKPGKSA